MNVINTNLPGVLIQLNFEDNRGFLKKTSIGVTEKLEFIYHLFRIIIQGPSKEFSGVALQKFPQGKLVSCSQGEVFDVAWI